MLAGGRWWAHAATGPAGGVPALSSVDLVHWDRAGDALPAAGSWAVPGAVSTPTLTEVGPDRFALWYSAVCAEHGTAALGVAVADRPGGPFRDPADRPALCRPDDGGARSPAVLADPDGGRRLCWLDGDGAVRARRLDQAGTAPDADPDDPDRLDDPDRPDEILVRATGRPAGAFRSITAAVTPTGPVLVAVTDTGVVTLPLGGVSRPPDDPGHPNDPGDSGNRDDLDDRGPHDPDPERLLAVAGAGRATVVTHPDGSRWLLVDAPAPRAGRVPLLWLAPVDAAPLEIGGPDGGGRDGGGRSGGAPPHRPRCRCRHRPARGGCRCRQTPHPSRSG